MRLLKLGKRVTLNQSKDIVAEAIAKARHHDLSIVIAVGDRLGDDLLAKTEVYGNPSVLRQLYKEVALDMPPEDL
jgi:hypothetical protein